MFYLLICNYLYFSDPDVIQDVPSQITQEEEERNMKRKTTCLHNI